MSIFNRLFAGFFGLGLLAFSASSAWADEASTAATLPVGAPPAPGFGQMLLPFLLMFAVVYFLMIRPQQKRMKEQQAMLKELKNGDEVVTTSGILGSIAGITDKVITLQVADQVKIKVMKSQVTQIVKGNINDLAV